jgi:hypothetical protein
MNDLTAKIRMREAVVELFPEVGYANEVGPREGTSPPVAFCKPNAGVQA